MKVINVRNVHCAIPKAMKFMEKHGVFQATRNGNALVSPVPITTVYQRPDERVVFHQKRDANPFFHLFESFWMLNGNNDVESLNFFSKNIAQFSDDGKTFHGAYGHRWRYHFGFDQINQIIKNLIGNKSCRRQVLQMWDSKSDLIDPGKDVPCNLMIVFQVDPEKKNHLNMTVFNRSNDMVWGAYGANAVHMSYLHEYVASFSGMKLGVYYQVSNNFHIYDFTYHKVSDLEGETFDPYSEEEVSPFPIWNKELKDEWDLDCSRFVSGDWKSESDFNTRFFSQVAAPIELAFREYKKSGSDRFQKARKHLQRCKASDWKKACMEWIDRREENLKRKQKELSK